MLAVSYHTPEAYSTLHRRAMEESHTINPAALNSQGKQALSSPACRATRLDATLHVVIELHPYPYTFDGESVLTASCY